MPKVEISASDHGAPIGWIDSDAGVELTDCLWRIVVPLNRLARLAIRKCPKGCFFLI